jgi:hypothetical protein
MRRGRRTLIAGDASPVGEVTRHHLGCLALHRRATSCAAWEVCAVWRGRIQSCYAISHLRQCPNNRIEKWKRHFLPSFPCFWRTLTKMAGQISKIQHETPTGSCMLFSMLSSGASLGWRLSLGALPKRPAAVRMDARFAPGILPIVIPNHCSIGQEDPDEREAILSLLPLSFLHPTGLQGRSMSKRAKGGGNGGGGGGGGEIDFSITPVSPSGLKPSTSSLTHPSCETPSIHSLSPPPHVHVPNLQEHGGFGMQRSNAMLPCLRLHVSTPPCTSILPKTIGRTHPFCQESEPRPHSSFQRPLGAIILPKALGHIHPSGDPPFGTFLYF